jgi:DNA-binding PadR family transcriptional regulator
MPRNALHNPVAVAALGVLLERPMHPYELATVLTERGVPVNRGSLYDTVEALARVGWIAPLDTERAGARPKRTPYRLTKSGRAELVKRLDCQIRLPRAEYPEFLIAVSHIGVLRKKGAIGALQERVAHLTGRIDELTLQLNNAINTAKVPRLFLIEAEYGIAMVRAERDWVNQTIANMSDGTIPWPKGI